MRVPSYQGLKQDIRQSLTSQARWCQALLVSKSSSLSRPTHLLRDTNSDEYLSARSINLLGNQNQRARVRYRPLRNMAIRLRDLTRSDVDHPVDGERHLSLPLDDDDPSSKRLRSRIPTCRFCFAGTIYTFVVFLLVSAYDTIYSSLRRSGC